MNKHVYLNLPDEQDQYNAIAPPGIPNVEMVDTIIDGKHVQIVQSSSTNITTRRISYEAVHYYLLRWF